MERLLLDACVSDKEVVVPEVIGSVYKSDFQMEQLKTQLKCFWIS